MNLRTASALLVTLALGMLALMLLGLGCVLLHLRLTHPGAPTRA